MCRNLGKKIRDTFKPDVIVAIARGGWVPARILCDLLDVTGLYSVKIEHWGKVATPGEAKIVQQLNVNLNGKSVLLVDDVTDTGDTAIIAREHLLDLGAKDVRIAVLDHKITSRFTPDFYVNRMDSWKWIVYPWSYHEDTRDFIEKLSLFYETPQNIQRILKEKYDFEVDLSIIEYVTQELGFEFKTEKVKKAD
jgi:hypothetical protein